MGQPDEDDEEREGEERENHSGHGFSGALDRDNERSGLLSPLNGEGQKLQLNREGK